MALLTAAFVAMYLAYASSPESKKIVESGVIFDTTPISGHDEHIFVDTGRNTGHQPVELPIIEPRNAEPRSLPWDDLNDDAFMRQGDRFIQLNRPHLYVPKQEVEQEPPKPDFNPLMPDDLKAYNELRSRTQKILKDSQVRGNYGIDTYHEPILAQNKTKGETAFSEALSGRIFSEYTSGATTGSSRENGAIFNTQDGLGQRIWGPGLSYSHTSNPEQGIGDRHYSGVHHKKQFEEFMGQTIQEPEAKTSAIYQPYPHISNVRQNAVPKYLNSAANQHGYTSADGKQQYPQHIYIDPNKTKKTFLVGDQGWVEGAFSGQNGYLQGLEYPETSRRREILPSVQFQGLKFGGVGFSFRDQNRGNGNLNLVGSIGELQTRDPIVEKVLPFRGEASGFNRTHNPSSHPFIAGRDNTDRDMRPDYNETERSVPAFHAFSKPEYWSDPITVLQPVRR